MRVRMPLFVDFCIVFGVGLVLGHDVSCFSVSLVHVFPVCWLCVHYYLFSSALLFVSPNQLSPAICVIFQNLSLVSFT